MPDDAPNLQQRDPHPNPTRFVGKRVSFNHDAGGRLARLVGIVEAQRFTGYTVRGEVPDYELTIRGETGKVVTVSLSESYAHISE